MKKEFKRRQFITTCYKAGFACCGLIMASNLDAAAFFTSDEKPDPKKLNYCGYQCPADCKVKQATVANDTELKKEAYKMWRIKEKYNFEFDASTMFCWGCKTEGKPLGVITANCSVRSFAIEKKYDCCIECPDLKACDKEIWKTFPQFKDSMMELQKKYLS
jgi:hypothetical protein